MKLRNRLKGRSRIGIFNRGENDQDTPTQKTEQTEKEKDKKDGDDDDKEDEGEGDKKNKGDDEDEEEEGEGDKKGQKVAKGLSTEQAVVQLQKLHEVNTKNIKKFLKLVASAKLLVVEINKLNTPLAASDLSGSALSESIKANAQHIVGTTTIFKEISKEADNRMIETFKLLQQKMLAKMKL